MRSKSEIRNSKFEISRSIGIVTIIALVATFASPALAGQEDRAGANSGVSLRFTPSGRGAAMGDAFTGEAGSNLEGIYYNPAGLAWPEKREISFSYQDIVLDVGHGAISYVSPLSNGKSSWGLAAQYVSYGSTQKTIVSGTGGANAGTLTGQDVALSATYGARIGENFSYGVTAKVFNQQIDDATATAFAGDLGFKWRMNDQVALGVAVKNIGTALQFDQTNERLPVTFRFGGSFRPFKPLLLTADVEKIAREGWAGHAGAEYTFAKMLSLRAGWDGSLQVENGFTIGAGVNIDGFGLDYAFLPFGDFGNNHRIGLRYAF